MRALFLVFYLLSGSTVVAAFAPVLNDIYPAGGAPGSELEVEVGGVMSDITHASVDGEGLKATLIGPVREETTTKKGRRISTAIPNRYLFKIVIDKEAQPGLRAFRAGTAYCLSEPLLFEVSRMANVCEGGANRDAKGEAVKVNLPVALNGRTRANAPDRYAFEAVQGATIVAYTEGRVLSRGPFCPALTFLDAEGKPCEGVSVYAADTAPVAVFEVPRNGVYQLEVGAVGDKGAGGVYRVKLGELPLVTGFAPPGAKAGESLNVRLHGVNLEQTRVRLFTGGKSDELCLAALVGDALVLPGLRFDLSDDPDVGEQEPNEADDAAQALALPCVVNGLLEATGARDIFRFSAAAGDILYADVRAQAIGSPLRPRITVRGGRGATVAEGRFDDADTLRAAVCGRDPSVAITVKEAGDYRVEVTDMDGRGGEMFAYRLRVGPPQPDYRVWMTPSSLNIPAGGSELVTLLVRRVHGFDGEVRVGLDFPPLNVTCEGGVVPAGTELTKMTVSTDGARFPRTTFGLSLTGAATIGGREVRRLAVPITVRSGSNGQTESFVCGEAKAKVGYGATALRVDPEGKYACAVDSRVTTPVAFKEPVAVSANEPERLTLLSRTLAAHLGGVFVPMVVWPPQGFVVAGVKQTNKQERASVLIRTDGKTFKPGDAGFFVLGCCVKGDTNRPLPAVSQCVPYVVR